MTPAGGADVSQCLSDLQDSQNCATLAGERGNRPTNIERGTMNTESKAPATVQESWRATLRCKYLPVTNHRGSRIKVARWDSTTHGTDPNGITVGWDHSLNTEQNYTEAVRQYLLKAEWDGTWVVSLCADGAVAVYSPEEA